MMSKSINRIRCAALLIFLISTVALVNAPAESWKQVIVRCFSGDLDKVRTEVGGAILDASHGHYLLMVPASVDISQIEGVKGRYAIEASDNPRVEIERRPLKTRSVTTSTRSAGPIVNYYGTPARKAYADQQTSLNISLREALNLSLGDSVRIAIIDTGIDEKHPTLQPYIRGGKNYVGWNSNPSELIDPTLSQGQITFMESQGQVTFMDAQGQVTFMDAQGQVTFMDAQGQITFMDAQGQITFMDAALLPPAFGHGTMVAGLAHLAAPHATIVPFKAFDATGAGSEWNVVRAVYDAIDAGADIINMSFSATKKSKLLEAAIKAAEAQGIVVVAAAGNDGDDVKTYPASVDEAIGIAALDAKNNKASFSNFGQYIDLSAPGVDLVTTYPGGHFAMGSGTSDAAPLVSGVAALAKRRGTRGMSLRDKLEASVDPIDVSPEYKNKLGSGRINALKAVK